MNRYFDIRRFGNYLLYDINNAKNRFGLSFLITGLTPVVMFIFYQIFFRMVEGYWGPDNGMLAPMAAFTTLIVITFTFPTKVYGGITDKRKGSDWLMIPASTLEKWLSMIILTCLILPCCTALLFFGSDAILSLAFPHYYGDNLIHNLNLFNEEFTRQTEDVIKLNFSFAAFLSWCQNILIFTLGAVVFKKAKPAKTLLCYIAWGIFIGNMALLALSGIPRLTDWFEMHELNAQNLEMFVNRLNLFVTCYYVIIFSALTGGLYYRLKTIKH